MKFGVYRITHDCFPGCGACSGVIATVSSARSDGTTKLHTLLDQAAAAGPHFLVCVTCKVENGEMRYIRAIQGQVE